MADTRTLPVTQSAPILGDKLVELLKGPEAQEGITAFIEKRSPSWKGK